MDEIYTGSAARLDVVVHELLPQYSRATAHKLIKDGQVAVDGIERLKASYEVRSGMRVSVQTGNLIAKVSAIPLLVVYEDEDVIVVDKPIGLLTHSKGQYNPEPTVASLVLTQVPAMRDAFAPYNESNERAGIVHRLDRATSGILIIAKHPAALTYLQRQFEQRKVQKVYGALVVGRLQPTTALVDMAIARNPQRPSTFMVSATGRSAQTAYTVLESRRHYSLLELRPKTGRTHQIRVHLRAIEHPIVGDDLYGGEPAERLYLHAQSLTLMVPSGDIKTFEAPLPASFYAKLASREMAS